jgi:hypothetical protein
MILRRADDDDWLIYTGMPAPLYHHSFVATDDRGRRLGLGGIFVDESGRRWITFDRRPGVGGVLTAHRAARFLVGHAVRPVFAAQSLVIEGAAKWLTRLGFEKTDEQLLGRPVWVLR